MGVKVPNMNFSSYLDDPDTIEISEVQFECFFMLRI
jgi:hypothetical protein